MATKKKKTTKKKTAKKTTKKAVKKVKKAVKKTKKAVKKTKKAAKKTTKKAAKKRIRKTKNSVLKPKDLEHFRDLLIEKRNEILGDVNHIEGEALMKSRLDAGGDLSSMPIHMADMGTDNFEQEFSIGLVDSERKILIEINAALQRIYEGVYGICEGTNNPIPRQRLEALPWARYCIEYASMVEKGLVIEGETVYEDEDDYDEDDLDFIEDEDEEESSFARLEDLKEELEDDDDDY